MKRGRASCLQIGRLVGIRTDAKAAERSGRGAPLVQELEMVCVGVVDHAAG